MGHGLSKWLVICICGLLGAPAAYAQDAGDPVAVSDEAAAEDEGAEDEDTAAFMDSVRRTGEIADDSVDYSEMHEMRVLERNFLPSKSSDEVAITLPPGNMLELSHDAAMHMLVEGAAKEPGTRGLQRQASRLMASAIAEVKQQIASSGSALEQPFGLDCINQPAVQEYIAIFSSPASKTMKTWLKRMGRYQAVLEKVLVQENVPADLIYLAMIESGFKMRVKSPASATGMWQFMAGTGAEMGLRIDEYVDERYDPIKSAHAAAQYLKKQYARYHSWPLAMAAYNGGPGTVNVAIDRFNTNDYFKLVKYGAMYDETRRYVPRILAAAIIGRNRAAFGFDGLTSEPPFVFDTVTVPGNTRLIELAKAAECTVDELKDLNPELLKDITPPGNQYELRIPLDRHKRFVERFDNVSKKYKDAKDTIRLRFGESIEQLGDDIGVPGRVLRTLNGMGAKDAAAYGSDIIVPNGSKRHASHQTAKADDDDKKLVLISPEKFDFRDRKRVFYETNKGDTLKEIAEAFGVHQNQLAMWNELDAWAKLRPGMVLQIYAASNCDLNDIRYLPEDQAHVVVRGSDEHQAIIDAKRQKNVKTAKANSGSSRSGGTTSKQGHYTMHTVGSGDSLSKIAKKYGVTVDSLLKLNGLKSNSTIRKGQKLKVKRN